MCSKGKKYCFDIGTIQVNEDVRLQLKLEIRKYYTLRECKLHITCESKEKQFTNNPWKFGYKIEKKITKDLS